MNTYIHTNVHILYEEILHQEITGRTNLDLFENKITSLFKNCKLLINYYANFATLIAFKCVKHFFLQTFNDIKRKRKLFIAQLLRQ